MLAAIQTANKGLDNNLVANSKKEKKKIERNQSRRATAKNGESAVFDMEESDEDEEEEEKAIVVRRAQSFPSQTLKRYKSKYSSTSSRLVDMRPHLGLRGFLALWIVIFHCFHYSAERIDVQGSVWMTQFFLISGFSLGVTYLDHCEPGKKYKWKKFYYNRLVRILPLFYIINFITMGSFWTGWAHIVGWDDRPNDPYNDPSSNGKLLAKAIAMTLVPISTWIGFIFGICFSAPGWTVSTLLFCYLCFPKLALWTYAMPARSGMQECCNCDTGSLKKNFAIMFTFQLLFAWFLLETTKSFEFATMIPYTRMPCFFMGIIAARDCMIWERKKKMPFDVKDVDYLPMFTPALFRDPGEQKRDDVNDPEVWAKKTDGTTLVLTLIILYYGCADNIPIFEENIPQFFFRDGLFWFQLWGCWLMMVWMVAMTRDEGLSYTSQFFNTNIMVWFGKQSMAIYLIHCPFIYYWNYIYFMHIMGVTHTTWFDEKNNMTYTRPSNQFSMEQHMDAGDVSPAGWQILVVTPISIFFGWLLTKYVDVPCGRYLRKQKKHEENKGSAVPATKRLLDSDDPKKSIDKVATNKIAPASQVSPTPVAATAEPAAAQGVEPATPK